MGKKIKRKNILQLFKLKCHLLSLRSCKEKFDCKKLQTQFSLYLIPASLFRLYQVEMFYKLLFFIATSVRNKCAKVRYGSFFFHENNNSFQQFTECRVNDNNL